MTRDPGREAVAYCEAKYSSMVDDADFFERRKDELMVDALFDCTEALIQTGENTILETLAKIGNRARFFNINGDIDDKIAFVDEVCNTMYKLIQKHAEAQAAIDLERRWGERG